jgi:hypothetical protein
MKPSVLTLAALALLISAVLSFPSIAAAIHV